MKKLSFLSFLFLCTISSIQAQFSLGMSAGANYNKVNSDIVKDQLNYYVGVQPTFALSPKFNVSAGIQYSLKGYLVGEEPISSISLSIRHNFLDVLPQIEYRPIQMLGIVAGMNIGYPLAIQHKDNNNNWSKDVLLNRESKNLDFGYLLGLRAYVKQFYLTAHYNHSLSDTNFIQFTDANGTALRGNRHRTIQIGLGYMVDW